MTQRTYNDLNGILLVDKPVDWTSHDVVNFVRRRFQVKKVGHCGTLDPFATGLLVILLGKATKRQDELMAQEKTYSGTMQLGVTTDSQDRTGEILEVKPLPDGLTLEILQAGTERFLGEQMQVPPMASAIKIHGQPLYKLARKGEVVEREPRPICIKSFVLENFRNDLVDFRVECSKGTYIRTLAADFGAALGCGAHLRELRRLASGTHLVADAVGMDKLKTWEVQDVASHLLAE